MKLYKGLVRFTTDTHTRNDEIFSDRFRFSTGGYVKILMNHNYEDIEVYQLYEYDDLKQTYKLKYDMESEEQ